jgi:ubiquinol-cytochrome c reductase iron-sulfur subunit
VRGKERPVAVCFTLSLLSGLGLAVCYIAGGQPQLEGALLAVSLGGLGAGLILWAKRLLPNEEITEQREPPSSPEPERAALRTEIERGGETLGRRRLLTRLLAGAAGALGLALVFPIRSLGPSPGDTLFRTQWRAGSLALNATGQPLHRDDLEIDGVVTVFPQEHIGSADSQTIVVRVNPAMLALPPGRENWAPEGYVAYSKVCTHAGCPVGLYLAATHELRCPCHQSTFDVLTGATPTYGPAPRPLPQLPIEFDADGLLRARSDYHEPVGPGFWDRP